MPDDAQKDTDIPANIQYGGSAMLSEAQKVAIRHLTPPKQDREMTLEDFAKTIGVTPRAIQKWEKENREFAAALAKSRDAYQSDPDWFERIARHHAMEALLEGARTKGSSRDDLSHKRACMKELLSQTAHVAENRDRIDVSAYTDAELLEMALTGEIDADSVDLSEFKEALVGR